MKATNKTKAILYTMYSCGAYLATMLSLFIWKWDEYVTYADGGTKIGMYGFVLIGLCLICFKNKIFKLIEASNILFTFSIIGFICCLGVKAMANELMLIFAFSLVGSAISGIFDRVVTVYKDNSFVEIKGVKTPNKEKALTDKEAWARAFGINFIAQENDDASVTD